MAPATIARGVTPTTPGSPGSPGTIVERGALRSGQRRLSQVIVTLIVPPEEAVPSPNQIDKDWLTAVLKKNGALNAGGIRDIQVDYSTSTNSHIARVRVEYDIDTKGDVPRSLILKTVAADGGFIQRSEVDYYTRDYLGLADAPIPKCYAAQVNDDSSYSYKDFAPTELGAICRSHSYEDVAPTELGVFRGWSSHRDFAPMELVGERLVGQNAELTATADIADSAKSSLK